MDLEGKTRLADRRFLAWIGLSVLGIVAGNFAGRVAKVVAAEVTCNTCTGTIDRAFWFTWIVTSLLATVVAWKVVKPPAAWPRWFLGNVLRFLAAFSVTWLVLGVIDVVSRDRQWVHAVEAPVAGLLFFSYVYLPGLLVYLVVLGLLPHGWSSQRRRIAAILLTPVIGAIWLTSDWPDRVWLATLAPLVYGVIFVDADRPIDVRPASEEATDGIADPPPPDRATH